MVVSLWIIHRKTTLKHYKQIPAVSEKQPESFVLKLTIKISIVLTLILLRKKLQQTAFLFFVLPRT